MTVNIITFFIIKVGFEVKYRTQKTNDSRGFWSLVILNQSGKTEWIYKHVYYFSTKGLHNIVKLVLQMYALLRITSIWILEKHIYPWENNSFISSTKQQLTENKEVNFGRHIKIHSELSYTMYCWKEKKAIHWLKYIARWAPMFSIFSYARESSGFLDQDLLMLWTTISLACQETQALLENIHLHHQMSSSAYLYNIYASWILSK